MKALIAGGGIGGVTAALSLLDAGIDVELYERTSVFGEVGAGIQISPNGVKVLERLGLKSALDALAFRPEALEMRHGKSGARIFSIPMREEAIRRFGAPYYHVHRADLMSILSKALRTRAPNAVHMDKDVQGYTQSARSVTFTFTDGSRAQGDVAIGADGIHSAVRTQMLGAMPARFTGNVAWRVVVPAASLPPNLVPPTACVWVGPGRHAVTYYLRRGELVNFVGVVEREGWQNESWTELGHKADLAADFQGFAKPITSIIEQAANCYRWALFDREPLEEWCRGRVTLLGDACHPMLPFLAQGAVMSIEDAWVLARHLKGAADVPAALKAYEAARKPRTSRAQHGARRQMGLYHKRGLAAQLATYGPMWLAARLTPAIVHTRNDWLYGVDVTAGG
ncbi:MAG: FAD-dependent monooxygenase [Alphaproteobacteria bacterium]|nr:FAD-dependent monooxygenase [Alphaproteobacteria bacterium]